jgi:prepilin-type processing-associated H-X9-DG protein
MVENGSALQIFKVMSNEIYAAKILHCPADTAHVPAKTFDSLSNANISYFANLEASEANPQEVLTGDSNLEINGKSVKSGVVSILTNDVVSWQPNRHGKSGNIVLADGSVQSATVQGLQIYFSNSGIATNRLAIP